MSSLIINNLSPFKSIETTQQVDSVSVKHAAFNGILSFEWVTSNSELWAGGVTKRAGERLGWLCTD